MKTTEELLNDAKAKLDVLCREWAEGIDASGAIRMLFRIENDLLRVRHDLQAHIGD